MPSVCPFMSKADTIFEEGMERTFLNEVWCIEDRCAAWIKHNYIDAEGNVRGGYCRLIIKT